jgi:hypothetical protein
MRSKFTVPGECIHYYTVEWDPALLSWADFREKLLGGTDPATAAKGSMRSVILRDYKKLGLVGEPNVGDNGVHASASPFEAMAERMNWLGVDAKSDLFAKGMLAEGIGIDTLKAWTADPAVNGKSIFDTLEDMDAQECLAQAKASSQ